MVELLPGVEIAEDRRVRVTRVIMLEGPVSWVSNTLEKRWLRSETTVRDLGPDKIAVEKSLTIEVL